MIEYIHIKIKNIKKYNIYVLKIKNNNRELRRQFDRKCKKSKNKLNQLKLQNQQKLHKNHTRNKTE